MQQQPQFIDGPHGRIAYRKRAGTPSGSKAGLVWLGGFRSDMLGTKAGFLDECATKNGCAYLRFDYSGHGESDGEFEDGCIGDWATDALAAFDALTDGPQILVGSSMGAWIATLLAMQRPRRVAAIIFIAPAPDFTEALMWASFSSAQRETLMCDGKLEQPSDYAEPEVITRKLIEDGRKHLVMNEPIAIACPVRIFQGMQDDAVPYHHALAFAKLIKSDDVEVTVTKSGDHRLSTPTDLARLADAVERSLSQN